MLRSLLLLSLLTLPSIASAHGDHACENNQSEGYACSHAEFLAHLSVDDLGNPGSSDILNDLWGWTDPASGREFVIVGMYSGTAFVEITDPAHPVFLGRLPSPQMPDPESVDGKFDVLCHDCSEGESMWMDVKVFDHYAYIVSEQPNFGLRIFDLHRLLNVETPQQFTADSEITSFGDAHNMFINEDTGFAYVVGGTVTNLDGSPSFGGLRIFDLNEGPLNQGSLNPGSVVYYEEIEYVHDVQCVVYAGPDADYHGHEICFASNSGDRRDRDSTSPYYGKTFFLDNNTNTYRSDWIFDKEEQLLVWSDGTTTPWPTPADEYAQLTVLDVTDKTDIKILSSAAQENAAYIHQSWLFEGHEFLMVNDERAAKRHGTRTTSNVFDVRDLDAIRAHADYVHPTVAIAHNEYVKGRFTYQANYGAGLRVLDISAPESPVQVAYFDTQPDTDDDVFYGTWTAYPFFKSGTIAMSDMYDGLFLARLALAEPEARAPDITVAAELLFVEGANDVFYAAYANNGPVAATEVDFTFHLPPEAAFDAVEPPEGMECSSVGRVVTCQVAEIPSCSSALAVLQVETSTIEADEEIVGMAAAKEIEVVGTTADNVTRVKIADGKSVVDTAALTNDLIATACSTPPVIDAGEDQSVHAGDKVTLHLVTDEPADSIMEIAWEQLEGPAVTLSEPHAVETAFTAPDASAVTSLLFRVSVTNTHGLTSKDKVTVTVNPKPTTGKSNDGKNNGSGGGALLYALALLIPGLHRRR